jgi:hypothetical protein
MRGTSIIGASEKLLRGLSTKFTGDPYIAEATVLVPSQFRNNPGSPSWFFAPNGIDYSFQYQDVHSASSAYARCPPLAAVINRKAQAYINGKTFIMNSRGKEATDATSKKLKTLLARPNPLQTWKQFEAQQYIYIQLYGFCICLPIFPFGFGANGPIDASSLWNIPPYMCSGTEVTTKEFYKAQKLSDIIPTITIKYKNVKEEIPTDDLFVFRDFTPSMDSVVFPDSRVKSLSAVVSNVIGAYESRGELIKYAGSQGLLTPETDTNGAIPLKDAEKEQLQADFKRQYGIKSGQFRYMITTAAIKWQEMGKATKDLMLFEEVQDGIMRICDQYVYPSPLLNSDKGPAVSNTKEFKAQVYQDAVIPESLDIYEQWNSFFRLQPTVLTLIKDYDHIPVLQGNQVEDGQAELYSNQALQLQFTSGVITMNAWREAAGVDTVPGDDIYYPEWRARNAALYPVTGQPEQLPTTQPPPIQPVNNQNSGGKSISIAGYTAKDIRKRQSRIAKYGIAI